MATFLKEIKDPLKEAIQKLCHALGEQGGSGRCDRGGGSPVWRHTW